MSLQHLPFFMGATVRVEVEVGDGRAVAVDLPKLRDSQLATTTTHSAAAHLHVLVPFGRVNTFRWDDVDAKELNAVR